MGIPPPLLTTEETDQGVDTPSGCTTQPNGGPLLHDSSHMPPLIDVSSGQHQLKSSDPIKLEDVTIPKEIISEYAPGQSSPSVKLLSPETFLSHSSTSPASTTPSLSLASTHLLRSPSDFESHSKSLNLQQVGVANTSAGNKAVSSSSNSQIVTLPLKSFSGSTDDEANDEMVLTSPSGSLPSDLNNSNKGARLFPSAHNDATFEAVRDQLMVDDDWPNLSSENTEDKLEESAPPLSLTDEKDNQFSKNTSDDYRKGEGFVNGEAKEAAALVVSAAISSAVSRVDGIPVRESKTGEGLKNGEPETTSEEPERGNEKEEEEEEEVKRKDVTVPPVGMETEAIATTADQSNISTITDTEREDPFTVIASEEGGVRSQLLLSGVAPPTETDEGMLESLVKMVRQQQLELQALRYDIQ